MMKMDRPPKPVWLRKHFKKWSRNYKKKLDDPSKSNDFKWASYQGKLVNIELLWILRKATSSHCAFCDYSLVKGTIEHFRPKSKSQFPLMAYIWGNLFPCCNVCQEKNDTFNKDLLKPDRKSYSFRKYFLYNATSGEIEVNPIADKIEKNKAQSTIKVYKLNRPEQIAARMLCFENYRDKEISVETLPYRFMF